ncbi:caspase family protein [Roseimicrobium gellanilyticum]|nr:caspase family protein [Roseimicrobium gellanilyticum]
MKIPSIPALMTALLMSCLSACSSTKVADSEGASNAPENGGVAPGTGKAVALAVGVNKVAPGPYNGGLKLLKNCVHDAKAMAGIAKARGFTATTLLDGQATRAAVRKQILSYAGSLKSGDIFVFSYAGHGSQAPDKNNDGEDDGLDETLCLYDGQMLDDELAEMWTHFAKGVRIAVYFDSCHSGTGLKNFDPGQPASPASGELTRTVPWSIQEKILALDANKDLGRGVPSERDSVGTTQASVLLISACQDDEEAGDGLGGNGTFTGALLGVWRNGAFSGSYRRFHTDIRNAIPAGALQKPNFYLAGKDNPAFISQTPWTK